MDVASYVAIVFTAILSALAGVLAYFLRKELKIVDELVGKEQDNSVLIKTFTENQDLTYVLIQGIMEGLIIALKSDDIQFSSFHESGLMNGDSLAHREEIREYLTRIRILQDKLGDKV